MKRRKAREKRSLFVAEGIRCVEELLKSELRIEGALATAELRANSRGEQLLRALAGRNIELLEVSEREFESAADTESPQGVLAVAAIPRVNMEGRLAAERIRVLVLDGIQDPGNAGTALRTAAALGVAATVALPGTVDLWNAKVVRSSAGAQFRQVVTAMSEVELANFLRTEAIELWAADAGGEPLGTTTPPARLAIAVGNEGAGLSSTVRALAKRSVSLPIGGQVESLNVAVAAGILLYELSK